MPWVQCQHTKSYDMGHAGLSGNRSESRSRSAGSRHRAGLVRPGPRRKCPRGSIYLELLWNPVRPTTMIRMDFWGLLPSWSYPCTLQPLGQKPSFPGSAFLLPFCSVRSSSRFRFQGLGYRQYRVQGVEYRAVAWHRSASSSSHSFRW